MAPHSSTPAWRIPWTEEPGGLQSMGSLGVWHDWATSLSLFTSHFHALEKEMATHSSILAWRIPWTEEPGGLQSMGSQRVRRDWEANAHSHINLKNFQLSFKSEGEKIELAYDSDTKETACDAADLDSIPGSGRSPREGNDHPFQYSCLENSMDRRAWRATVHGVAKSQMCLSN